MPVPVDATVWQAFQRIARAHPERPFLSILPQVAERSGIAPLELTYGRALDAIEAIAARLRDAGYGHGHRVGLLLDNRPDF
ncbi:MAG: AMP-binding protein, partial [Burkholderiaceae bacterium]